MPGRFPAVSIIVPTYREAANIRPLTERVFAALRAGNRDGELIIVDDDSRDGTEQAVEALQSHYPVRVVVRRGVRGLSSAVLEGFRTARHDALVVMDADLQHPPESIPAIVDRLEADGCEFVLGTRYATGASVAQGWSAWRRRMSRLATLLAAPLGSLSDPMSGFFALRRSTWEQAGPLSPLGYKIGLELFVKSRCTRFAEVPIPFAERAAGQSKYNVREILRFMRHLQRLYRFRFPWAWWGAVGCVVSATAALAFGALAP